MTQPILNTSGECAVEGCHRTLYCKSYCRPHYYRWREYGDPGDAPIRMRRKESTRIDGPEAECQGCGLIKVAEDYYINRGSKKQPVEPYRCQPCKDCVKAARKTWRDANPELIRDRMVGYRLSFYFGISQTEYEALLVAQGGGCGICGIKPQPGKKRLHVDHDHQTGTVRGILCGWCNTAIGLFGEDVHAMKRAVTYLEMTVA